jgi:hypothetical protein
VPLPEAYRSLLRPSSPDEAKASINCCNWFMQNDSHILGVYLTYLLFSFLNFQRTKLFVPLFITLCTICPATAPLELWRETASKGWPAKP